MLNEITRLIDSINILIKEYPIVFHALVPIGTIATAILGIKNTNHIKTQANIQREIESNRFNIELFEHRMSTYTNFRENIKGREIFKINAPTPYELDIESIKTYLSNDYGILKKSILSFNSDDNNILVEMLDEKHKLSIVIDNIERGFFSIKEKEFQMFHFPDQYEYLSNEKQKLYDDIKKYTEYLKSPIYDVLYHESINYMEKKLELPNEAFKPHLNIFHRLSNDLSKSEKTVIFGIAGICALGLWCALLFEVAFRN